MSSKVFRLRSEPNNYPWGKVGKDSLAAQLAPNSVGKDFELDPKKEYAELWMGTHPNNPSSLFDSPSTPLTKHLSENESLLGEAKKFPARYPGSKDGEFGGQGHVPFLFKILTCKQALPLQIHPDIELAKKLHEQDPEQFLDTNHKPEIAVCLSESFLGFASFRPIDQARALLNATPEIQQMPTKVRDAVKALDSGASKEDMRNVFEMLISVQGEEAESSINTFIERLKKDGAEVFAKVDKLSSDEKERLVRAAKILDEYNHGDASIYASLFLMNLVELKKGEGMYVGADAPHAWLSGEIVELMAASDNVLNVGFIPSEDKNSTSLVAKAITATPKSIPEIMLDSHKFVKSSTGNTTVYEVPFEEFSILQVKGSDKLKPLSGCGIAIVVSGENTKIGDGSSEHSAPRGSVWFVGAGSELSLEQGEADEVWMAFYDGDKEVADQVGAQ